MQNELVNGTNVETSMKNLYKNMMRIMMQMLGSTTEDTLTQLNSMRDALTELINEFSNGDAIIE